MRRLAAILRCPRCRGAFDRAPGELVCAACGARAPFDGAAVDLAELAPPPRSLGDRAMASRAMARLYDRVWRPLSFNVSTAFRAPAFDAEATMAIERIAGCDGPWLDLSCGPGALTRRMCEVADGRLVVAADLSLPMLERARRQAPGAARVRADAMDLPFVDGAFGAVANLAALDLYPDAPRAIAEVMRVLAPGGVWIASAFVRRERRIARPPRGGPGGLDAGHIEAIARRAGFVEYASRSFGRYVVVQAKRPERRS